MYTLLLSVFGESREASRRYQCINNLKSIGLALHNYREIHGCFPPAAIVDRKGKPLLSWRVALLPFLQEELLYAEFQLDEAWDGPYNSALLTRMPKLYSCPSDAPLTAGATEYQAMVGEHAAFGRDFKPIGIAKFADGTRSTLLIGESLRTVPWTKPDDLAADDELPRHGLDSRHADGFNALPADGSTRFLKNAIKPKVLAALITRNGGETLSDEEF